MSFYLAKFYIDDDGDWSFDDFEQLNGKKFLFDEPEDALEIIREHLRTCMNTISSRVLPEDKIADIFKKMKDLYDSDHLWRLDEPDESGNILYIYCNFDNYLIHYKIDELNFYESEEVLAVDFDDSDYDEEYEEDEEEGEEEIE